MSESEEKGKTLMELIKEWGSLPSIHETAQFQKILWVRKQWHREKVEEYLREFGAQFKRQNEDAQKEIDILNADKDLLTIKKKLLEARLDQIRKLVENQPTPIANENGVYVITIESYEKWFRKLREAVLEGEK